VTRQTMLKWTAALVFGVFGLAAFDCDGDPVGTLVVVMRSPSLTQGKAPLTVQLEGEHWHEGGLGAPVGPYQWNFGDGNSAQTREKHVVHEYVNVGSYRACLTVSDSKQSAVSCLDVTVVP